MPFCSLTLLKYINIETEITEHQMRDKVYRKTSNFFRIKERKVKI
jgi:hypothetical protein